MSRGNCERLCFDQLNAHIFRALTILLTLRCMRGADQNMAAYNHLDEYFITHYFKLAIMKFSNRFSLSYLIRDFSSATQFFTCFI